MDQDLCNSLPLQSQNITSNTLQSLLLYFIYYMNNMKYREIFYTILCIIKVQEKLLTNYLLHHSCSRHSYKPVNKPSRPGLRYERYTSLPLLRACIMVYWRLVPVGAAGTKHNVSRGKKSWPWLLSPVSAPCSVSLQAINTTELYFDKRVIT
ncbi:hypothetical protein PUN28_009139 [Cardiocondyla obscurior]|uniref:Uncharacterized protein n=1 Tax=Cardiocondyla obscurior TaxID=286306 RepID=A0AAW2FQP1_9HYME